MNVTTMALPSVQEIQAEAEAIDKLIRKNYRAHQFCLWRRQTSFAFRTLQSRTAGLSRRFAL